MFAQGYWRDVLLGLDANAMRLISQAVKSNVPPDAQ